MKLRNSTLFSGLKLLWRLSWHCRLTNLLCLSLYCSQLSHVSASVCIFCACLSCFPSSFLNCHRFSRYLFLCHHLIIPFLIHCLSSFLYYSIPCFLSILTFRSLLFSALNVLSCYMCCTWKRHFALQHIVDFSLVGREEHFACGFVWVWNLVADIEGGTQAEGVWE